MWRRNVIRYLKYNYDCAKFGIIFIRASSRTYEINLSLERVQKFGLRICLRNYHTSYEYLLDFFKFPSLKNRRIFLSLCTFYLIKNHLVHFPSTGFLPPPMHHTSTRIYDPFGYYLPHAHALQFLKIFFSSHCYFCME